MISVQFPETTVENIEMLVREIVSDLIYILLCCYLEENVFQVRLFEISESNPSIVI